MLLNYGAGEDSWAWTKAWTSWTVRQFKPVSPKGNQPWIVIGRTDAEVEAPILWPPDGKNWPVGKDPDAGKDWRRKETGMTEAEMVGWHHRFNGHEFEHIPRDSEGQGSLAWCSSWGQQRVRHDWVTEQQNQGKQVVECLGTGNVWQTEYCPP